jgi:BirA family biotin operon repressor/biotin-[acetyl-CoA-carboxylase] ligase
MSRFPAVAGGLPVAAFEEIGSTNMEALARASAGAPEQWIVARRQLAGRGRRGRPWVSEPGNLYCSVLLYDPAPPAAAAQICFVAALALHDAIADRLPEAKRDELRLKWPNDLLLGGRKISGILVEGMQAGSRNAVVIGMGVNCAHAPENAAYPATSLAAEGIALFPETLLGGLADALLFRLSQWAGGTAFALIRRAWLDRVTGLGSEIEVRLPERVLSGRFASVDDAGALLVDLPGGGREIVRAGDVFPLPAMR